MLLTGGEDYNINVVVDIAKKWMGKEYMSCEFLYIIIYMHAYIQASVARKVWCVSSGWFQYPIATDGLDSQISPSSSSPAGAHVSGSTIITYIHTHVC